MAELRKLINVSFCSLILALIASCGNPAGPEGGNPGGDNPASQGGIKFNLTGAKAVGAADIAASKALKGVRGIEGVRAVASRAGDEYGLVKVLENGKVELAVELPENVWMPRVLFIAKSPVSGRKDLFVAFDNCIRYYDNEQQKEIVVGSFLHILEDGTYYSIIDKENGRVKNYSWYGNDNYKPVSFDSSGRLYFVFENYGASTSSNQVFKYDPAAHVTVPITAPISGTYFNNFEVSGDGQRLFVQGERQSGGSRVNFFRVFPLANIENPISVFYSSNSNTWVRGYKVSPSGNSVILNGNGIRGINGLLRATVVNDASITYEPLFDSANNNQNWFQPEYNEWYSDWENKTYYNGLFDRFNVNDVYLVMTDKTKFYYLRLSEMTPAWASTDNSPNICTTPTNSDWNSQGWIYDKPLTASGFGFATDLADFTRITDSTVTTSAINQYNDIKGLADTAKRPRAVTFVRRWNNGVESTAKFEVPLEVVNKVISDPTLYSDLYQWNDHWFKGGVRANGLDTAAVMTYLNKFFMDDVQFKYGGNAAGQASFDAFASLGVYSRAEIVGTMGDPFYFVDNYFVKADGSKAMTLKKFKEANNLQWLNLQDVSSVFYDGTGACWAIVGGSMWGGSSSTARPVKILDSNGKKTLGFVDKLNGTAYNPVSYLISGNRMFFRDGLLDAGGFESGYHKMYMLDVTAPSSNPTDVLVNVPENGRIEIASFSVSGNLLYFTGVKGTGVVGGKVDLSTLAYTPLGDEYMLRNIEVY